eukprot:gnl/TRDRNA2_/TRDRNA2_36235_c0_seq1.p1 gnl/TRDRNA2_/TRDRNA2_36235_c0~~gnl/TRDRNA2_/TRDRNA2_36235_c0_seq1.p1  ORF type:complete len:233 (+),score=60.93 gnl/TRDRNA2_/TRDRNA2_36235_c0_seq1:60-758(+)
MNPYHAYASDYGGGGTWGGNSYTGDGANYQVYNSDAGQSGWWSQGNGWGASDVGGCAGGWEDEWASGGGGGKGGGWKSNSGKGKSRGSVMCKFFLAGTCTRGAACSFSHGEGAAEDEDSDPELQEIQKLIMQAQGGVMHKEPDDDALLAQYEEEEEKVVNRVVYQRPPGCDDVESDGDDLPPEASEEEKMEANQIFQKAQREAMEREKMKQNAKGASRDDLQAMINARIAQR